MTTTTNTSRADIRARREQLGLTRLTVALRAEVSQAWLAALEAGLRPAHGSRALDRVEAVLEQLEADEDAPQFVKFADVREHLTLGPPSTDGPRAA